MDMSKPDNAPLQRYLKHLENGELAYQYSPAAGRPVFFPRIACPYTGSQTLEWRVSSGRAVVYAASTIYPASGEPYNVSLIDCREGFRLMSRVEDVAPDDVRLGMEVRLRIVRPLPEEPPIPVFVPAGGQS